MLISINSTVAFYKKLATHTHKIYTSPSHTNSITISEKNSQAKSIPKFAADFQTQGQTYTTYRQHTAGPHYVLVEQRMDKMRNQSSVYVEQVPTIAADLYVQDIHYLKQNALTDSQILYFSSFNKDSWANFINNLNLQNPHEIFEFHGFYQFPAFVEFLKSQPGYNQAMTDLFSKLNHSNPCLDKNLYDQLNNTKSGTAIYQCLMENKAVKEKIKEKSNRFAHNVINNLKLENSLAKHLKDLEIQQSNLNIELRQL